MTKLIVSILWKYIYSIPLLGQNLGNVLVYMYIIYTSPKQVKKTNKCWNISTIITSYKLLNKLFKNNGSTFRPYNLTKEASHALLNV